MHYTYGLTIFLPRLFRRGEGFPRRSLSQGSLRMLF